MTYEKLYDLKYNKGISTYELVCRFPHDIERVSEVAMLEIPEKTLNEILPEKSILKRLKSLKKKLMGKQKK